MTGNAPTDASPFLIEDPKLMIKRVLSERTSANEYYSLRAFARDLKISPQQLSNFLSGKRGISVQTGARIASALQFNDSEAKFFVSSVQALYARSAKLKAAGKSNLSQIRAQHWPSTEISLDTFRVVSDWHHYALLELIKILPLTQQTSSHMAERLLLAEDEIKLALKRLERLKLIKAKPGRRGWKVNQTFVSTSPEGVPSDALHKFQKQLLEKAITALVAQPLRERSNLNSFLPLRRDQIPEAKKMIKEFHKKFLQNTSSEDGDTVYAFSTQLFSVTK